MKKYKSLGQIKFKIGYSDEGRLVRHLITGEIMMCVGGDSKIIVNRYNKITNVYEEMKIDRRNFEWVEYE